MQIEIYWDDLTDTAKERLAEEMDEDLLTIEERNNWDSFPMITYDYEPEDSL